METSLEDQELPSWRSPEEPGSERGVCLGIDGSSGVLDDAGHAGRLILVVQRGAELVENGREHLQPPRHPLSLRNHDYQPLVQPTSNPWETSTHKA